MRIVHDDRGIADDDPILDRARVHQREAPDRDVVADRRAGNVLSAMCTVARSPK